MSTQTKKGTPAPTELETMALNIQARNEQLQREQQDLLEQQEALQEKLQQAQEAERATKLEEYNSHREQAAGFRLTASKEADEASKRMYIEWALEADKVASSLAREIGLATEELPAEEETVSDRAGKRLVSLFRHRMGAIVQLTLLALAIVYMFSNFNSEGRHIQELNKALPDEQKMSAYDATAIQKLYFEKYVELSDLPMALSKLLIVVPFICFYLLPFIRTRRDFFTEFFEDLTPFQRCLLVFCFFALALLHSALSHGVKP